MIEDKVALLEKWYKRIKRAQRGHYKDAKRLKTNKTLVGLPTVVLTTIVGTGFFAAAAEGNIFGDDTLFQISLGVLSLLAAIFASLQTFLNYSEKSEKHLNAARRLSSLKKEIQQNLITLEKTPDKYNDFIGYIRETWDEITNEAPLISERNYERFFKKNKETD